MANRAFGSASARSYDFKWSLGRIIILSMTRVYDCSNYSDAGGMHAKLPPASDIIGIS